MPLIAQSCVCSHLHSGVCPVMVCMSLAAFPAPAYLCKWTLNREQTKQQQCDTAALTLESNWFTCGETKQSLCLKRLPVFPPVVCKTLPYMRRKPRRQSVRIDTSWLQMSQCCCLVILFLLCAVMSGCLTAVDAPVIWVCVCVRVAYAFVLC